LPRTPMHNSCKGIFLQRNKVNQSLKSGDKFTKLDY
jgi:hypothetical protein